MHFKQNMIYFLDNLLTQLFQGLKKEPFRVPYTKKQFRCQKTDFQAFPETFSSILVPQKLACGDHIKHHHSRHKYQRHDLRPCVEALSALFIILHCLICIFALLCHFYPSFSFVICFACVDLECSVYLFEQHNARQLMRKCDLSETQSQRRA